MALISKSSIQEVNDRLDAVSVVGDYVRLEKKSGRFWGKCPFHAGGQEKTPSFTVDPDLKLYHCFGCNKGGSVIGFIMEMENLSYPEAIKLLAQKIGVELVYEEGGNYEIEDTSLKEQLYELYSRMTVTFTHFLKEKPEGKAALNYLEDRGITDDMIDLFKLGFAPADRNFLYNFLKKKSYSDEFLEKSGLFSKNYKTMSLFSNRLMFPITDRNGRIVAFSGRAMPQEEKDNANTPKYINSPETEIYKKGQTLYAIDIAKNEMRKTKTVVLAEGNVDVIALHKAGVANAVAPLGTAFTDEQASWLSRWVEKAILIFDNDEAGQKAAFKAILTCRKYGISCSIVNLSEEADASMYAKDPAEILQKKGSQVLKNLINFTIFDFEYLLKLTGEKSRIGQFLFPYLTVLSSEVGRDDCIAQIADFFRIDKKAVLADFANWKKTSAKETGYSKTSENGYGEKPARNLQTKRNFELITLAVAALNFELYPELRSSVQISQIDDPAAKELYIALEECFAHGEKGMEPLLARINDESLRSFIVTNGGSQEFRGNNASKLMEDGIKKFKIKKLEKEIIEIKAEMSQKERAEGKDADNTDLLSEIMKLDSKIKELKGKKE